MARPPGEWLERRLDNLKTWQIIAIIAVIILSISLIAAGYYYGVARQPPTAELNELTVKSQPHLTASTFPTDKTVSVNVYNQDQEQVRSVTLTSPGWQETLTGLEVSDHFYVQSASSNWYWMRDQSNGTDVQLNDDSWARRINVSSAEMAFTSQFIEAASVDWMYGENETGLTGAGDVDFTLTEKFEMTGNSAFKGCQLRFQVNNTSSVNLTSIDFDSTSYLSDDWNVSTSGNVSTYKMNVTGKTDTGWDYYFNKNDATNKTITISGEADINAAADGVQVDGWIKYVEEGVTEDNFLTTSTQSVYLQ